MTQESMGVTPDKAIGRHNIRLSRGKTTLIQLTFSIDRERLATRTSLHTASESFVGHSYRLAYSRQEASRT